MTDMLVRGGFGIRQGHFAKAGEATITHQHNFDHVTYLLGPARVEELTSGEPDAVVVRAVDKPRGGYVHIPAGKWHRITALADDVTYHCIYVHRNPYGAIVDEYDGWQAAYE